MIELGVLKSFDPIDYRAEVQLVGSLTTYFDDVPVARNITALQMSAGRHVLLATPGDNPKDACVIAVWDRAEGGGGASFKEDTMTGTTTNDYADALDWDSRGFNTKSITIKNTGDTNSLDYKLLVRYSDYDGGDDQEELSESTLDQGETALLHLNKAYSRIKLQVKSTVADQHTTYEIDYLGNA